MHQAGKHRSELASCLTHSKGLLKTVHSLFYPFSLLYPQRHNRAFLKEGQESNEVPRKHSTMPAKTYTQIYFIHIEAKFWLEFSAGGKNVQNLFSDLGRFSEACHRVLFCF